MKLTIHPGARAEIREAAEWYERQVPLLGTEFKDAVEAVLLRVSESPSTGSFLETLPPDSGVLRVRMKRFPYLIVYEIVGDEIQVLAVTHQSRRPNYWLERRRDG